MNAVSRIVGHACRPRVLRDAWLHVPLVTALAHSAVARDVSATSVVAPLPAKTSLELGRGNLQHRLADFEHHNQRRRKPS